MGSSSDQLALFNQYDDEYCSKSTAVATSIQKISALGGGAYSACQQARSEIIALRHCNSQMNLYETASDRVSDPDTDPGNAYCRAEERQGAGG